MLLTRRPVLWLRSAPAWTILGMLAPVGMLLVCGIMLLELRRDAWDKAEQTSKNLIQVIERDIARNAEIFDLTLRAAADNLRAPGLAEASPELRQLILFSRAATARDMGVMIVLDETGNIVADLDAVPPRKGNYTDRDYFQAHRALADVGLFIGRPLVSRLTGERMLPFSRRITKPDGSFGGVVMGSVKLSYFTRLFDQINLGPDGAINLYHRDGTRIMRHPFVEADIGVNIASAPNFERFVREGRGSFVAPSIRDGIERHYTFTRIGDLPLLVNVSLSTKEIEAAWRVKAIVISSIVLVLCGLTMGLSLLFGRELRRRAAVQAELAELSLTDALTGLPNRRRFEEVLARSCESAERTGKPLALLVVDADHFKRYNDRYGHAVGDEVLKGLARCLAASVHRPGDLVCRVGGEEFVLLLPDTDTAGAQRIADEVHTRVSMLSVGSAGIGAGAVTVSIGLACTEQVDHHTAVNLYRTADKALYAAKAAGRNRTQVARLVPGRDVGPAAHLRVVDGARTGTDS